MNLLTGFRGAKAHAVDTEAPRNRHMDLSGMSLCGWRVQVGELPFRDLGVITCRTCARSAAAVQARAAQ